VSASAKASPDKFFIGIDANARPLEKLSTKVTRKPAKGGLSNAIFVQEAVEALPEEFVGIADEIFINFPWGSLLGAVAMGDRRILRSLYSVLKDQGSLKITLGTDPTRDRAELDRLGVPELDLAYFNGFLSAAYADSGLRMTDCRELAMSDWSSIETSWARRLGGNDGRRVYQMTFRREDRDDEQRGEL
jgi:16S rRNA (adenine(1408)-N(1))-methyltransferase